MPNLTKEQKQRVDALLAQGLKVCPQSECPAKGEAQPVANFFPKKGRRDGLSGWCRACHTREGNDTRRRYLETEEGREKAREAAQRRTDSGRMAAAKERYRLSEHGREKIRAYSVSEAGRVSRARYKAIHALEIKARAKVNNAVQVGNLPPVTTLTCVGCGAPAEEYHHHLGYEPEHWLDVVPACEACHTATLHRVAPPA